MKIKRISSDFWYGVTSGKTYELHVPDDSRKMSFIIDDLGNKAYPAWDDGNLWQIVSTFPTDKKLLLL